MQAFLISTAASDRTVRLPSSCNPQRPFLDAYIEHVKYCICPALLSYSLCTLISNAATLFRCIETLSRASKTQGPSAQSPECSAAAQQRDRGYDASTSSQPDYVPLPSQYEKQQQVYGQVRCETQEQR